MAGQGVAAGPVSYTHLDVYKRQVTPYAARRGLPTSGDLTFRLDTTQRTVRIVGVAEGWTCLLYTSRCV